MIRPPGEAHAGDGKVKGTTAKDIIPDWALYLSIGCGFIGMLLIGIAVAQRYVFLLPRSLSGIFMSLLQSSQYISSSSFTWAFMSNLTVPAWSVPIHPSYHHIYRSHNNEAERRLREQGEQLQMPTHPRRNLSLKPSPTLTNSQTATV